MDEHKINQELAGRLPTGFYLFHCDLTEAEPITNMRIYSGNPPDPSAELMTASQIITVSERCVTTVASQKPTQSWRDRPPLL